MASVEDHRFCVHHEGEEVTSYCGQHADLCCSRCVSLHHEGCHGVNPISDSVRGVRETPEFAQVSFKLDQLQKGFQSLRADTEEAVRDTEVDRNALLLKVHEFRRRLDRALDHLEEKIRSRIEEVHDAAIEQLNETVENCERFLSELKSTMANLGVDRTGTEVGDSDSLIKLRRAKQDTDRYSEYLDDACLRCTLKPHDFQPCESLERNISGFHSLGSVLVKKTSPPTLGLQKHNAKLVSDSHTCHIEGSVFLPDGRLVLADTANRTLKLLDENFSLVSHCDLPGNADGMALVKTDEIVVCTKGTPSKLLFVEVGQRRMFVKREMDLDEKCYGVACIDRLLFVSCGAKKGRGHVQVRDTAGRLVSRVHNDVDGRKLFEFSAPGHLSLSPRGSRVYVAGGLNNSIVTMTTGGVPCSVLELDGDPKGPWGICTAGNGMLFVACEISDEILSVNPATKTVEVLLSRPDGIQHPLSVAYNERCRQLLVTLAHYDEVKVFTLPSAVRV